MNIGFVSTWLERGAAYVTKSYIDLLKDSNKVFVYARGGEYFAKGDPNWDLSYVTWGLRLRGTSINYGHFKKWIKKNNIDILFFNEQRDIKILYEIKRDLPNIKIGAYIDYYKENTVDEFRLYDFLICNTKRHYSVFQNHKQCYYVPWGTDINLFKPQENSRKSLTFFHSSGMSLRKGTELLIKAFIEGELYKQSNLVIHTQINLEDKLGLKIEDLKDYNIKIINKTVSAPGLYHLGDVYVYPTTLDGLGLTMYEALSCGLPVITTDNAPMNEVINDSVGYLVDVKRLVSRADGYYWPLSICDKSSLIKGMKYFVRKKDQITHYKEKCRETAIKKWNWQDRENEVLEIFNNTKIIVDLTKDKLDSEYSFINRLKGKVQTSYFSHVIKSSYEKLRIKNK